MKTIDDLEFGIPKEIEKYTAHSAEIAIMILNFILSNEGMNKKEFAALLGKTPSDVTRWVSGSHNFTIQTLSLIEAKTGMQIIRNLSDSNRKKHLKGEIFNNLSEKELYSELMNKYMDLLNELKKLKANKLEELHEKFTRAYMCLVKNEEASTYFKKPTADRFSTSVQKAIVCLDYEEKERKVRANNRSLNVVVRALEK